MLAEVVDSLQRAGVGNFAIIGGWSPLLLNRGSRTHPGTRDVDVLFKDGPDAGALKPAISALLSAGYMHSAKHEFQLLRQLDVSGTPFVFNVDLLHPQSREPDPSLFAEHLVLPVPLTQYRDDSYIVKSIVVPHAEFIFAGHVVWLPFSATLPSGGIVNLELPLMDEVGLIVTKAKSLSNPKRPRDSFDVFLAVAQARDYAKLLTDFRTLAQSNKPVFNTLYHLRKALDDGLPGRAAVEFFPDFARMKNDEKRIHGEGVQAKLEAFLNDIPLPAKATQ